MRIKDARKKHGDKGLEHYPIAVGVTNRLARQMAADRFRYVRHRRRGWMDLMRMTQVHNPFKSRLKAVKRAMKNLSMMNMLFKAGWLGRS